MRAYVPHKTYISVLSPFGINSHKSAFSLKAIIEAESIDGTYDEGLGGVRLAEESAIVMKGTVKGNGPMFTELMRYTKVTELKRYVKTASVEENIIPSILEDAGVSLICTGSGTELYKDPGEGTERIVILAPTDAAEKALASRTNVPLNTVKKFVINFIGGDDLMTHEVVDGVQRIVQGLAIPSTTKVAFHSLCHADFPLEKASVTVLALNGEATALPSSEIMESVGKGEVYFHEGKWWTTLKENINYEVA